MKNKDITGYDPDDDVVEPDSFYYSLERVGEFYVTGERIVANLQRNGENVGLLFIPNEEEYAWLKARITGTFRPEKKDIE